MKKMKNFLETFTFEEKIDIRNSIYVSISAKLYMWRKLHWQVS